MGERHYSQGRCYSSVLKCRTSNHIYREAWVNMQRRVETFHLKGCWTDRNRNHTCVKEGAGLGPVLFLQISSYVQRPPSLGFQSHCFLRKDHIRRKKIKKARSKFILCKQKLSGQPGTCWKMLSPTYLYMPQKIWKCDSIKLLSRWVERYSPR